MRTPNEEPSIAKVFSAISRLWPGCPGNPYPSAEIYCPASSENLLYHVDSIDVVLGHQQLDILLPSRTDQFSLLILRDEHLLFDAILDDNTLDRDAPRLTKSMNTVDGLLFNGRSPP